MDYVFRDRDEVRVRPSREGLNEEHSSSKTVTIRGVDGKIYDEFSQVIQSSGMTMGDAISKMMRDVSKDFDEVFPKLSAKSLKYMVKRDKISVEHYDDLNISLKDLEEADKRVKFQHIGYLSIGEDVNTEAFETYIAEIRHCQTVRVPDVLPKLLIYSKIAHCNRVEIYTPEAKVSPHEPVD